MPAHLFVLAVVALLFTAGPAAAAGTPSPGSAVQGTGSTLVIDRTVDRPEKPGSRLWVGAVVGVFGVVGLVVSRAFNPSGHNRGPDGRPTA